jgi:hypothetical protein
MIYLNTHSVRARRTAHQYRKRLSTRQEEFLVEWILEQETQGFPPSHARTCEMASRIIRMNGDTQELGKRFVLYRLAASPVQGLDGIWNGLSMELHMESTGVGISSDSMDFQLLMVRVKLIAGSGHMVGVFNNKIA